jgi:citrate synthase
MAQQNYDSAAEYPTSLGTSTTQEISLMGQSLAGDLMGTVGFSELAFWMTATRRPTPGELRTFDAVLVALADHGFTPIAIAARLTYLSAPESIQGAIASGLLGGGSRFLGVTEDCGKFLNDLLEAAQTAPITDAEFDALATEAVTAARAAKRIIPGLGHPVHKQGDPRTPRLFQIAEESGTLGDHMKLFAAIGRASKKVLGKDLPLNGAGVCGAALADLGLPIDFLRGFSLLARTAGLLGQIAEEKRNPVANDIYMHVDRNAKYVAFPETD